jgi:hypothetical protein
MEYTMAASRSDILPCDEHIKFFTSRARYIFFNRELILYKFKELFSFSLVEREQHEKQLYQNIHYAALYLMYVSVHYAETDLQVILPSYPLPTAISYQLDHDTLMLNLGEYLKLETLNIEIDTNFLLTTKERLTKYIYLYKDAYLIFQYTEILLRYLDGHAKKIDLDRFAESSRPTLRETTAELHRTRRALSQLNNEQLKKKLNAFKQKKSQAKIHTPLPAEELSDAASPNVFNDWCNQEYFFTNGSDDLQQMPANKRADLKFSLLFIQQLIDDTTQNYFSKNSAKLLEIFTKQDIVRADIVTDLTRTQWSLLFHIDNEDHKEQEKSLERFLKLQVIAKYLGTSLCLDNTAECLARLMLVFENANELFTFFEKNLERYITLTSNGIELCMDVPVGMINSESTVAEIFSSFTKEKKRCVDDTIFETIWKLNSAADKPLPKKPKSMKARTPKGITNACAHTTIAAPPAEKKPQENLEEKYKQEDASKQKDNSQQNLEIKPTPVELVTFNVQHLHTKLKTNLGTADTEYRNLQQEYRKLFRTHRSALPKETLAAWAQCVENLGLDLERMNGKHNAFNLTDEMFALQNCLMDFHRTQTQITAFSMQVKKLKRELNQVALSVKNGTLFIQQKLAEKNKARVEKNKSSGKTPPLRPENLPSSPVRLPSTLPPTERLSKEAPALSPQEEKSSFSAFSLFDASSRITPRTPLDTTEAVISSQFKN